jgi:nitrate/nitrite-specific signal transduction histidine kinase
VLEDEQQVSVTIRDDGAGFDPAASTDGFGLTGMRERAELLGGELSVRSAPGDGTTISVAVPAMHRPPREVPVTAEPATKAAASATVSVGATGPQR